MTSILRSLKLLACILPALLFVIFFKPIVHTGLGSIAKLCLRYGGDCELAYRQLEWKEGKIVLLDAVLFELGEEKSSFHLHADRVSLDIDWRRFPWKLKGHLEVVHPHVLLSHYRPSLAPSKKGGWLQLTMDIREGIIEWADITRALFSYERPVADQLGQLKLILDETDLFVEAVQQNSSLQIHAVGKQVDAHLLQAFSRFYQASLPLASLIQKGQISGQIHLLVEEKAALKGSMQVRVEGMEGQGEGWALKGLQGSFDWEGSAAFIPQTGLLRDILPSAFPTDGRVRCDIEHAELSFREGNLQQLQGHFSYNGGMGAKWELQATGTHSAESFPITIKGRSYFHSQRDNWLEAFLQFEPDQSPLVLRGEEEETERLWTVHVEQLTADKSTFLQALAACYDPTFLEGRLQQGVFSMQGEGRFGDAGLKRWRISHFAAQDLLFAMQEHRLGCAEAKGFFSKDEGHVLLVEGRFHLPLSKGIKVQGENWQGECVWENAVLSPSSFKGTLGPEEVALEVAGTWDAWKLLLQGDRFIQTQLCLEGSWEGMQCHLPRIQGKVEEVQIAGQAAFDLEGHASLHLSQLEGEIKEVAARFGHTLSGQLKALEPGLQIQVDPLSWDWSLHASIEQGTWPAYQIEKGRFEIIATPEEITCLSLGCDWISRQGAVHFSSPCLIRKGTDWTFDIRISSPTWDLVRLAGVSDEKTIQFDTQKSHLFGSPFQVGSCILGQTEGLQKLEMRFDLPWKSVLAAGPYLSGFGVPSFVKMPIQGEVSIDLQYAPQERSSITIRDKDLRWKGEAIPLDFHAFREKKKWLIDVCKVADFSLVCALIQEKDDVRIEMGMGKWKEGIQTDFQGKIDGKGRCDFSLSNVHMDLAQLHSLTSLWGIPIRGVQGILEGSGHFVYEKGFESDFDLSLSQLRTETFLLENQGAVHLFFSPEKGMAIQGLDLQAQHVDKKGVWLNGKIDLVQYDSSDSSWILTHSHLHLPSAFFSAISNSSTLVDALNPKSDWDLIADWKCSSDFSTLSCKMEEGFVSLFGEVRHLQHLECEWTPDGCLAICDTSYKGHEIRVGLQMVNESLLEGKLVLKEKGDPQEAPLTIDWRYGNEQGLTVHTIEGVFGGVEASFHAETEKEQNVLIGSARIQFETFSTFLPAEIAEVFQQIKMGKGYELKGRLTLDGPQSAFQGILSGKALELFGFQFRTLLAQVDLSAQKVKITNLKISDTAGILKIEEICMGAQENTPWMISIPQLTVLEFRPTLLQKAGEEAGGKMSPLVVREFKLSNFQGELENSKTYRAEGYLKFANSYKREKTVFDLPSDVLGRIVGLDLELFIPVCGTLDYCIKDGLFQLLELKGAFSEGQRSEFLLEKGSDGGPFMDLDGNLKILIQMKQFVLFKLTDAFLISIEGTLTDPQVHLQKKKRFWGL